MPRQSSIKRLPAAQRSFLEKLIREDRFTLDEIIAQVRERFPAAQVPSRSAVGRYKQNVDELAGRMRDIQAAGTALVTELGEDPNDRAGQLLVQAVTTLATHAALKATDAEAEELSIKEIGQLARAAHATMQSRKMSLAERQEIARLAREQLQAEQAEKLKDVVKAGGMTEATAEAIRKQILGIAA
ncbi:phage protein Gp27 family protein [Fulvimonas yonginensis]|uniref:Phage protein Gp27 family protein n=1 Tax=Fulvimonas yonginensis TaxID=1495200 RepID=A0ABU8JAA9_9GAMM